MRVNTVSLRNYRGFETLDLHLDPEVTMLVGVNGAGKTSILDAIAGLLSKLTGAVRGRAGDASLSTSDVRVGAKHAEASLVAAFESGTAAWSDAIGLPGQPAPDPGFDEGAIAAVEAARRTLAADAPNLPLAVYFPTNRAALDIPARIRTPHEFDALSAYDGALEGGTANFRGFFEWFRQEEDLLNEEQARQLTVPGITGGSPSSRLPLVRSAIEALFHDAKDLRIERRPQRMTISIRGTRIDVASLSEGEKCLLAMTGDLARRMILAAPAAEEPLDHPAVVLIDELELHLHPALQRAILPRLRGVFPKAQFIVSTHSPQVVSSVRAENVRLLRDFQLVPVNQSTWHRDTNRILEGVFGDPGRPEDVARKLNALRDAVDHDRFDDARALIEELRSQVEGEDPDVELLADLVPPRDAAE